MKSALKYTLGFFSMSFLVVAICLLALWFNLDKWVTPPLLQETQTRWLPDYSVPWEKIDLKVTNLGWLKKRVQIDSEGPLCFKGKSFDLCFKELQGDFTIQVPSLEMEIKSLRVTGGEQSLSTASDNSPTPPSEATVQSQVEKLKGWAGLIKEWAPETVRIDLPAIQWTSGSVTTAIALQIFEQKVTTEVKRPNLDLSLKTLVAKNFALQDFFLKIRQTSKLETRNITIQAPKIQWQKTSPIDVNLVLKPQGKRTQKLSLGLQLFLASEESRLGLRSIRIQSSRLPIEIAKVNCELSFKMRERESTSIDCPNIQIDFKKSIEKYHKAIKDLHPMLPPHLSLQISGSISEGLWLSDKSDAQLVALSMENLQAQSPFLKLKGKSQFILNRAQAELEAFFVKTSIDVNIPDFSELVVFLTNTPYAVPAPLNSLGGDARLTVSQSEAGADGKGSSFDLNLDVRLSEEPRQRVWFTTKSTVALSTKLELDTSKTQFAINLERLWLHLPPFDPLAGVPQLTGDSRIKPKRPLRFKPASKTKLPVRISVKSQSPDSIRIYHKLFKPYLAGAFNMDISRKGLSYEFLVRKDFRVSYLKRDFTVQKISVSQKKQAAAGLQLDVLVQFDISPYLIDVQVLGSAKNPGVSLSSQPSLPREDIISLLIYKRKTSELTRFESSNVGGTEAAVADRAIGLFGLWVFASTPIESVSYDARTRSYNARVSLPGELSLNLGTDWEKESVVGLGRRIGGGWSLATEYKLDGDEQVGNVYIQKEMAY